MEQEKRSETRSSPPSTCSVTETPKRGRKVLVNDGAVRGIHPTPMPASG